jgi:hypothetical protein
VAQAVADGKTNSAGHRATPQPKLAIARKKIASEIAPRADRLSQKVIPQYEAADAVAKARAAESSG